MHKRYMQLVHWNITMELSNEIDALVAPFTQTVARQDSGVPEDLASPTDTRLLGDGDDADETMNSDLNITVIHVVRDSTCDGEESLTMTAGTEVKEFPGESKDSKDGSDSGVEGCATEVLRVRSRNSVDYGSSCGGLDEASCDSSLVSCCSVYEDPCATLPDDLRLNTGGEGTSEGGSESSSIAGSISARGTRANGKRTVIASATNKKKLGVAEPQKPSRVKPSASTNPAVASPRSKTRVVAPRTVPSKLQPGSRDRGRSKETKHSSLKDTAKEITPINGTCRQAATQRPSATPGFHRTRTRAIPESLPSALTTEINKDLAQRGRGTRSRGGSSGRGRTPGSTPLDEGKKLPSTPRANFATCMEPQTVRKDKIATSLDNKALDTYATLPRRNRSKFAVPKSNEKAARSRSGSRDASLNRMNGKKSVPMRDATPYKSLPSYARIKPAEKTRIYHEISVQTGLTRADMDNVFAGLVATMPDPARVDRSDRSCQTEGSWKDTKLMQTEVERVTEVAASSQLENEKLKIELAQVRRVLEEEKADHAFARRELDRNAQRVLAMLGTPQSEHTEGDSFLELESHIQSSGQVVANQQIEIEDLQSLCRMLNRDLEKSMVVQKTLLQQHQELEAESIEMQDFLQEEKATLAEALKDAEAEIKKKDELVKRSNSELGRQIEECKHLVRISEQRRQENLLMNLKLNAVERRSRDLLLSQGAAVSGAAVALSGLGTRLEALVDQLVTSYNISEKDLEDVIYINEAYSCSNSSVESSPVSSRQSLKEFTPSPKRGSFVSAVIGAIRNAATHPFVGKPADRKPAFIEPALKQLHKEISLDSSSDLLDFETEPCLMMESVLEDVPLPDTYTHNMVSSSDSLRRTLGSTENGLEESSKQGRFADESTSLSNLTQAILHRRKVEVEEHDECESLSESETGITDNPGPLTDYCPAISLVDQVIDVDNLVTKLLKVLRIIQLDNDTCIQELREEKSELECRLESFVGELEKVQQPARHLCESENPLPNMTGEKKMIVNQSCHS
ncbi:uncharacterized protein LOC124305061 isoform X1 [Neodiprion virginianus]|uniref:uncharacterized protein LOC124305061 isoform X1 n=1 Tax=Neodiprion virginianus TaxID=2961670 RepID=UPI001EE6E9DE|nr:uncharacterized protein LOC124305061 isoform X1 [Neodiprion virginianus]XP_046620000.1 uncharacterized protein LOC124305061 isoform X1 [Neodiprion virginianus]XP_046620001.1 uncharacterized protein LOC124305061 isoform X1 [Neodiprion virginianus]